MYWVYGIPKSLFVGDGVGCMHKLHYHYVSTWKAWKDYYFEHQAWVFLEKNSFGAQKRRRVYNNHANKDQVNSVVFLCILLVQSKIREWIILFSFHKQIHFSFSLTLFYTSTLYYSVNYCPHFYYRQNLIVFMSRPAPLDCSNCAAFK